jgi:hypothetical protein
VVAEAGDPDSERTLVFLAHHDAAHGGLIFTPELITRVADAFPRWFERQETSPQVMRLVVAGPALVALGALTGRRRIRRTGALMALASALAFADIAARRVVPGANDNLTSVAALLEIARRLRERPVEGVRVLLVSTGSEESFMEGMRGFGRRHFGALDRDRTEFVCLESLGSPQLALIEGEGMLAMRDYPEAMRSRPAARARHRRPDRPARRLPHGRDRLRHQVQVPGQLPLPRRRRRERELRDGPRRRRGVRGTDSGAICLVSRSY